MKFKKLISLSVCAMLALSSIASAATFSADEDGWALASEAVTSGDVVNYDISAKIDVTRIDAAAAKEAGLAMGKGTSALTDDNSDFFKIELTANVGDLVYAYIDDGNYDPATMTQVRLYNANVTLPGIVAKKIAISGAYSGVNWTSSDANAANLAMYWNAGTLDNMVPTPSEEGTVVEDAAMDKVTYIIAMNPLAANVTVNPTMKVTYSVKNASEDTEVNATNATFTGSYVFEAEEVIVDEDKPVVFTADLKEDTDFGYIWALTFTQSADKLASFTAMFEAADVEPAERSIQNVAELATALGGKSGDVILNVGLSTTKTLTKATFTADDADAETDACVVVAPLSK